MHKEKRDKFAATLMECIYIGYAKHCKAYQLYHKLFWRIFESWDIIFDEGTSTSSWITIEVGGPSLNSTEPQMEEPLKEIAEEGVSSEREDIPQQTEPQYAHHQHHNQSNQNHSTLIT
jgi:hypothetical protein